MKNTIWRACTFLAATFLIQNAALSQTSSDLLQVTSAAQGFYAAYSTLHPSDGIPDAKARAKLEPFISAALDSLLIAGETAERHFSTVTRHMSPPLIEGDLFTSNFEGATSHHVGQCGIEANSAHCTVAFGYRGGSEDKKPFNWTDTVLLVHTDAGWKVDDIAYGGNAAFGNKGHLKETLQGAIRDGNDASQ